MGESSKKQSKCAIETVEKPASEKLTENAQMQGFRNPENRGVHRSTPQ